MIFQVQRANSPTLSPYLLNHSIDTRRNLDGSLSPHAPVKLASKTFYAADANITFISSDDIIFKIHHQNLAAHSCGFPPADIACTPDEVVPLTEDGETLELLFSFMYPCRHSHLRNTSFKVLSSLAEAAEKYQVFAAMNVCEIRMRMFLPKHAQDVMAYASRHGYIELMNLAAPALLDVPLDVAVSTFPPSLIRAWTQYYHVHTRTLLTSLLCPTFTVRVYPSGIGNGAFHSSNDGCTVCSRELDMAMRRLYTGLSGRRSVTAIENEAKTAFEGAQHISTAAWLEYWRSCLKENVKKFETFI